MLNNYRELTGREKQRIKKLITSLCANYDKEYGCRWTANVLCLVSALPTVHCVDISANLSCRKMQSWKPYSRKHQPLIFALGKPCAARFFEGISALAGC